MAPNVNKVEVLPLTYIYLDCQLGFKKRYQRWPKYECLVMKLTADQYFLYYLRARQPAMFNHSHIRQFLSLFVSLRGFQLITQNSSENIASRQSRCIYVNGFTPSARSAIPGVSPGRRY